MLPYGEYQAFRLFTGLHVFLSSHNHGEESEEILVSNTNYIMAQFWNMYAISIDKVVMSPVEFFIVDISLSNWYSCVNSLFVSNLDLSKKSFY